MKYLKKYNKINESLVDKKVELLDDLSMDLRDIGLEISIWKEGKFIHLSISDDQNEGLVDYYNGETLYNSDIINEFEENLKSYNMNYRTRSGHVDKVYYTFDKWGSFTDKYFK